MDSEIRVCFQLPLPAMEFENQIRPGPSLPISLSMEPAKTQTGSIDVKNGSVNESLFIRKSFTIFLNTLQQMMYDQPLTFFCELKPSIVHATVGRLNYLSLINCWTKKYRYNVHLCL